MTITPEQIMRLRDPLEFGKALWPHVDFYREQQDIIYSVEHNDETFVCAGNMLGKDFVTAFIVLSYFLRHYPCRIVTTSVKDDHLRVLWGEIGRFIDTSRIPLLRSQGMSLVVNHREIRRYYRGELCKVSYILGCVSERGEGMAGHHAPYTLMVGDEASGIDDQTYNACDTWARKKLFIGNPNPCNNFFKRFVKAGDLLAS